MAPAHEDVHARITRVFQELIEPAVARDGGCVEFVRYDAGIVYVRLAGACVHCPASLYTLTFGVERILKEQLPEVVAVATCD